MLSGIGFVRFDSKSALREHLRTARTRTVLIGADVEAPREFYSAILATDAGAPIEIGLIAGGLGTKLATVSGHILLNSSSKP